MRRYEREDFRRLTDAERYRDYDYLADDAWVGPNERIPHGFTRADEPPWSTLGGWEARPFAAERAFDEDRGQGRQYGRDLGLGYGRPHESGEPERSREDDYRRGLARQPERPERHERPRAPTPRRRRPLGTALEALAWPVALLLHPLETLRHPIASARHLAGGLRRARRRPPSGPKGYKRSDLRIFEDVCQRLTDHPDVDASEIEVTVRHGHVTLEGEVHDRRTKYLAEDVADDVLGVRDVRNRLRIGAGPTRQRSTPTGASAGTSTAAVRR